jgi:hypothetical protein
LNRLVSWPLSLLASWQQISEQPSAFAVRRQSSSWRPVTAFACSQPSRELPQIPSGGHGAFARAHRYEIPDLLEVRDFCIDGRDNLGGSHRVNIAN